MKLWNVYKSSDGRPSIGDRVRCAGVVYRVLGSQGSDSEGVPYLRLQRLDAAGLPVDGPFKVALATDVERV